MTITGKVKKKSVQFPCRKCSNYKNSFDLQWLYFCLFIIKMCRNSTMEDLSLHCYRKGNNLIDDNFIQLLPKYIPQYTNRFVHIIMFFSPQVSCRKDANFILVVPCI